MGTYNFYKPGVHEGFLPVRVLGQNIIDWFEKIGPNILEQMKHEVDVNKLQPGIECLIDDKPIHDVPNINENHKLVITESYCQYLWNLCYALYTTFVEGIEKPSLLKQQNKNIIRNIEVISKGIYSIILGLRLFNKREDALYFNIPNPEIFNEEDTFYIKNTNVVYLAAMTWILYHEFAHQYYGHIGRQSAKEELKKHELDADDFATEMLIKSNFIEYDITLKAGIIAALGSIIMCDSTLDGGKEHPNHDIRFERAIRQMNLKDEDDMWGLAAQLLSLWLTKMDVKLEINEIVNTPKEFFEISLRQIRGLNATSKQNIP